MTQLDSRVEAPTLERKLTFVRPFLGFPNSRNFLLAGMGERYAPYLALTSLDEPNLQFIVVSPGILFRDYVIEIPDADVALLGIERPDDAEVLCLVTNRAGATPTANLLGPIVVNWQSGDAAQVVLTESDYRAAVPVDAGTSQPD